MEKKLYKTAQGYVITSDDKIKTGDKFYYVVNGQPKIDFVRDEFDAELLNDTDAKKIMATDTTFKLESIPQFELQSDNIEDRKIVAAGQYAIKNCGDTPGNMTQLKNAWVDGFNTAQEVFYTEEQMMQCWRQAVRSYLGREGTIFFDEFIKSIKNQSKEIIAIEIAPIDINTYLKNLEATLTEDEREEIGYVLDSDTEKDAYWKNEYYKINRDDYKLGLHIHDGKKYIFFNDNREYIGYEDNDVFVPDFQPMISYPIEFSGGLLQIKSYVYKQKTVVEDENI